MRKKVKQYMLVLKIVDKLSLEYSPVHLLGHFLICPNRDTKPLLKSRVKNLEQTTLLQIAVKV